MVQSSRLLVLLVGIFIYCMIYCVYIKLYVLDNILKLDDAEHDDIHHVPLLVVTGRSATIDDDIADAAAAGKNETGAGQAESESSPFTPLQIIVKEILITNHAEKNDTNSLSLPIPPQPTMGAFIHLGKTGGQTLQQLLRNGCAFMKKKPCQSYHQMPESRENLISKLTTYYHVAEFAHTLRSDNRDRDALFPHKFFVMTLRDPLERAISAFLYMHPTNIAYRAFTKFRRGRQMELLEMANGSMAEALAMMIENRNKTTATAKHPSSYDVVSEASKKLYSCFDSLEQWAQMLENFTEYEWRDWRDYHNDGDCINVAKSTLHHSQPWKPLAHNYWDLRAIMWRIDDWSSSRRRKRNDGTTTTILGIRTEFMLQDWISAHRWLGEEGKIFTVTNAKNSLSDDGGGGGGYPVKDKWLSDEGGKKHLCLALKDEYRLYLKVLVVSENLSDEDVAKSLDIARRNCPWLNLTLPTKDERITMRKEGVVKEGWWEFQ